MPIKLPENGQDMSLVDSHLLETLDQLVACNVRDYVQVTQIVIVGDQSSGKSSVLEGITKLNFPRDSGLCTRFATQVIFRRDGDLSQRIASASIIPASGSDAREQESLLKWCAAGLETLSSSGFSLMIKEVHKVMGLSLQEGDELPTFSNHILRIEIRGPEENHLSFIDVPGIFKNTTPGKTTKEDIELVRNMARNYMRNERSIILAVVSANVDIANQEIIDMAREFDPDEKRTLKIFTKPDLVDKGAEGKIIDLVENSKEGLGWVVLRNLGQQEMEEGKDRDAEEDAWHKKVPWSRIQQDNWGTKALVPRLRELLLSMARRSFPLIRNEISKKLKDAQEALEALGIERETAEQQRRHLLGVICRFQEITRRALSTHYGSKDVFDKPEMRLITRAAERAIEFGEDITKNGHKYAYADSEDWPSKKTSSSGSDHGMITFGQTDSKGTAMNTRKVEFLDGIELNRILYSNVEIPLPQSEGIIGYLTTEYQQSRGFEIGTFNSGLLATLMKTQSEKWVDFTRGYISDIIVTVHKFICSALRVACPDKTFCMRILSLLGDDILSRYELAIRHTEFLLQVEREGTPMTLNHYMNDNLQKCRQKRIQSSPAGKVQESDSRASGQQVVRMSDLMHQDHMSNSQHTLQDIHDILKSYYKVSLKRFIDNVCMQVTDFHLVSGDHAPMSLFSPEWVHELSSEQLEELAREDSCVRRRRGQLRKEIEDLEAGRKVLL